MKKVLIITYYFPPAGGPGVQRWLKFVKYLPDFDIQPIVYVPKNPTYPIIDNDLVDEIPENAIVLKHKIFEPYQIAAIFSKNNTTKISSGIIPNRKKQTFMQQLFLWIRGNIFIPDARIYWVKPSVKFLEEYILLNKIDTIITSGPPHSLHLIGLKLKQKFQVNWIADFRDPWTTIGYHKDLKLSDYTAKKHKNLEKTVLNTTDTIIVTSKTTKQEFEFITDKPIDIITNGYDNELIEAQSLDSKFSMAHIGSFLSDRNPEILWQSINELISEVPDFKNKIEIKLIGKTSQEVLDSISKFELDGFVNNLGYVSHKIAVQEQRKSQVLLLIEIDSNDTKSIIPGKLFEYMVSDRPIIAIGPKNSDFEVIINQTKSGEFFTYDDKIKLKKSILECYNLYLDNNLKSNAVNIDQFSRRNLTEKLAKLIFSLDVKSQINTN